MTLANILFFLVIVSGLATLGMLFAGLISMSPQRREQHRGRPAQQPADVVARAPAVPDHRPDPSLVLRQPELSRWSH